MARLAIAVIARVILILSLTLLVGTVEKSVIASPDVIELAEPAADLDEVELPALPVSFVTGTLIAFAIDRDRPMPASVTPSSVFRPPRPAFV